LGGAPSIARSLLEFNLSNIPQNSTITSAKLSLYWGNNNLNTGHSSISYPNVAYLKKIIEPWGENTVTWNNQPNTTNTNMVTLPQSTNPTQDYSNIDITTLVQDMVDNPSTSFGFLFKQTAEQYYRAMLFASSDFTDASKHPKITIIYNSNGNGNGNGNGNSIIELNLGNDTTLCLDNSLELIPNIGGAQNYLWQDGTTNPTYTISSPGTYFVQVATCSNTYFDTININFETQIGIPLPNDTTLCTNQTLLLDATINNASYIWQDNSINATFLVNQTGTYWVDTYSNSCFIASDTININYPTQLSINLGNDTTLCPNSFFSITSPYPNLINIWQDLSSEPSYLPSQGGLYWLSTSNSCETVSDTIQINIFPTIDLNILDINTCNNTNLFFQYNTFPYDQITNLVWTLGDNTTSIENTPSHSYNNIGDFIYELNAINSFGCSISATASIHVHQSPIADFNYAGNPIHVGDEINFINLSQFSNSWLWNFDNTINSNIENPFHTFNTTGNQQVTLIAYNNYCKDSIKIDLHVKEDIIYFVPNAFTPGNDNLNNNFSPIFSPNFIPSNYHLIIFNRWGELVFESIDYNIGWDGKNGNTPIDWSNVYIWKLEFKENYSDKKHSATGHVVLLK